MATFDYITAIRDRLLLLLERHAPTAAIRVGNKSRIGDTSRLGLGHKPRTGQPADFPELVVKASDGSDAAFSDAQTFGDEEDDATSDWPAVVSQSFEITVTHEALNQDANNAIDLEVVRALRKGRARLKDPNTVGSSLAYVMGWGPVTSRRTEEDVKGTTRAVTRFTVPVSIQLAESELDA
jgi:hypothetical protein